MVPRADMKNILKWLKKQISKLRYRKLNKPKVHDKAKIVHNLCIDYINRKKIVIPHIH